MTTSAKTISPEFYASTFDACAIISRASERLCREMAILTDAECGPEYLDAFNMLQNAADYLQLTGRYRKIVR